MPSSLTWANYLVLCLVLLATGSMATGSKHSQFVSIVIDKLSPRSSLRNISVSDNTSYIVRSERTEADTLISFRLANPSESSTLSIYLTEYPDILGCEGASLEIFRKEGIYNIPLLSIQCQDGPDLWPDRTLSLSGDREYFLRFVKQGTPMYPRPDQFTTLSFSLILTTDELFVCERDGPCQHDSRCLLRQDAPLYPFTREQVAIYSCNSSSQDHCDHAAPMDKSQFFCSETSTEDQATPCCLTNKPCQHGRISGNLCICNDGWEGDLCHLLTPTTALTITSTSTDESTSTHLVNSISTSSDMDPVTITTDSVEEQQGGIDPTSLTIILLSLILGVMTVIAVVTTVLYVQKTIKTSAEARFITTHNLGADDLGDPFSRIGSTRQGHITVIPRRHRSSEQCLVDQTTSTKMAKSLPLDAAFTYDDGPEWLSQSHRTFKTQEDLKRQLMDMEEWPKGVKRLQLASPGEGVLTKVKGDTQAGQLPASDTQQVVPPVKVQRQTAIVGTTVPMTLAKRQELGSSAPVKPAEQSKLEHNQTYARVRKVFRIEEHPDSNFVRKKHMSAPDALAYTSERLLRKLSLRKDKAKNKKARRSI